MLKSLYIKNYAIIESLHINFSDRLTIITGETGAGKSILLGALGLILGERADIKTLQDTTKKCVVEGVFEIGSYNLTDWFETNDLDYSDEVIIRREISPAGKSRAFVNDSPLQIKELQLLCQNLVDLHQQFEQSSLNKPTYQLQMLDALSGLTKLVKQYQKDFNFFQQKRVELENLQAENQRLYQEKDYLTFLMKELDEYQIRPGEETELEKEQRLLENAEEICKRLGELSFELYHSDYALVPKLEALSQQLNPFSEDEKINSVLERLRGVVIELKDTANEMEGLKEGLVSDPARLDLINERADKLNRLFVKHRVSSSTDLLDHRNEIHAKLKDFEGREEKIETLQSEIAAMQESLQQMADDISLERKNHVPSFEKGVNNLLKHLRMEHAQFRIALDRHAALQYWGVDDISFLFSPNLGSNFMPIQDVASGGELSRLSLITKSIVAASLKMPTLVFDEVDSGISGDVALKMGHILKEMATNHQIVCITHTPHVAAKADAHFFIYKEIEGNRTRTRMKELSIQDRIYEIATMLSSSPPSDSAMANARELVENSGV